MKKEKKMKAYRTWDEKAFDPCATIVFCGKYKRSAVDHEPFNRNGHLAEGHSLQQMGK